MTLATKNIRADRGEVVSDISVHTTDALTATDVVFYRLAKRFVEDDNAISKEARDVIYYTLATGHNTGIVDCFEPKIAISRSLFNRVLDALPEGKGKSKLFGIEKFGEIQLDKMSVEDVISACESIAPEDVEDDMQAKKADRFQECRVNSASDFKNNFLELASEVRDQPQVYCLCRRVTD